MRQPRWEDSPDSWLIANLSDIAEIIMGQSPPGSSYNELGEGLPFFQGKAEFGEKHPVAKKWCTEPTKLAEKNDILMSVRAPVGTVNLADRDCCIGRGLAALRVNTESVLVEYLYAFLQFAETYIAESGQGSTFAAISGKDLTRLLIPVPPLEEQQEIVNILQQAEDLRRLRQDSLEKAEKLASALFLEMFGNPLDNTRSKKPLGELGTLDRGLSKHRPRNAPHLFGGKYPFVQTGDVAGSNGFIKKYKDTYSEEGLKQSKLWPKGTLCITIAANIANTGILQFDACFPDSVVGFVAGEKVTPEYVMFAINVLQKVLETQATQSAQKNINLKVLRILAIPVPTEDELHKFTSFVKNVYSLIDDSSVFDSHLSKVFQAIEYKAFTGTLTQSWRNKHSSGITKAQARVTANASALVMLHDSPKPENQIDRNRHEIINQLSHFQKTVWKYFQTKEEPYVIDDLPTIIADIPDENITLQDQARLKNTLVTFTTLGLIAKVSIANGEDQFIPVYRALRDDDAHYMFRNKQSGSKATG